MSILYRRYFKKKSVKMLKGLHKSEENGSERLRNYAETRR